MARHAQVIVLTAEMKQQLQAQASARTTPQGQGLRLRIVLAAAEGKTNDQISKELKVSRPVVRKWRGRFAVEGLVGLKERARSGKPRTYDEAFRKRVLATLEQPPPPGQSAWDGALRTAARTSWREAESKTGWTQGFGEEKAVRRHEMMRRREQSF